MSTRLWSQSDWYFPVPNTVDCKEFEEEFGWLMVGEDLAYFSNEDGPRDTTEIAHTIGTDSSIFGPDLDDSECLLEILCLFAGELDDHQVIFPTNKGSPALLILDSVEEIQRNNFFDISRDCFGL